MHKKYRILSIDGGGVRGIIPARILQEIEEKAGKPIYQLFDMIVGTSTGALIALHLTFPTDVLCFSKSGNEDNVQSAEATVGLYRLLSKEIFHSSILHNLMSGFNLWGPKYDRTSYDNLLGSMFKNTLFKDTKCKVVIPSYDLMRNKRIICKSWENFQGASIKEIAGGATAAPTYFSPISLASYSEILTENVFYFYSLVDGGIWSNNPETIGVSNVFYSYSLVDGGIWCNNPETIGVSEAITLNPELTKDDIYILSIGTGSIPLTSDASQLQNAGLLGWLKSGLINMMMETESEWTATAIKEIYPNMVRIEPYLPSTLGTFDDASDENLAGLLQIAEKYIENNPEQIKGIVESLNLA
jgi:patatin-like phospholipase/acyl hydrolase